MNVSAYPTGPVPLPPPIVPSAKMGIDLTDRRLHSIMNVAVFTPYAIYLAQGKRPPLWLTLASLAWLGVTFLDDLSYLTNPDPQPLAGLGCGACNGSLGCGCAGIPSTARTPMLYRVNR